MVIDFHTKNQVIICKRLGKKSGKLILTDGQMDWQSANLKTNYKTMPGQKQYLYIFLQNKRASKIWNGVACNGR